MALSDGVKFAGHVRLRVQVSQQTRMEADMAPHILEQVQHLQPPSCGTGARGSGFRICIWR